MLRGIMQRDDADLSATEQIRISQEWSGGTGHVLNLWSAVTRKALYPKVEQLIKATLTPAEQARFDREHSRPVLLSLLREHQLAGADVEALVRQITEARWTGPSRFPVCCTGGWNRSGCPNRMRCRGRSGPRRTHRAVAHELAAGLDDRRQALAERVTDGAGTVADRSSRGGSGGRVGCACARTTPGGQGSRRRTGRPQGSPTRNGRSAPNRTGTTRSLRRCVRRRSGR